MIPIDILLTSCQYRKMLPAQKIETTKLKVGDRVWVRGSNFRGDPTGAVFPGLVVGVRGSRYRVDILGFQSQKFEYGRERLLTDDEHALLLLAT